MNAYQRNMGILSENEGKLKKLQEEHKRLEKAQRSATLSTKLFGESFEKSINKMKRSLNNVSDKMISIGETMSASVTAPIVGGFSMATKKAIEFEDQMTKLKSVMDDSALQGTQFKTLEEGMNGLKEASLNLSKTYGESTEKINEGMIELAKNGYKIKEITDISNQGMLGAKATGEEYNSVISTLSGTMRTFGLLSNDQKKNAENTKMAMEQLVSVANSSATGVGELGYAFSKMGGLAKASGMDIAQAGSMFGVLRDRNIEASTAATSLKSGLINISKAAKAVAEGGELNNSAKAFLELGINLEDVYKNGLDLPKLLREMQKGSAGMTAEAKKAALGAAFGKETVASWVALMDEKAIKSLEEYTKKARESNGSLDELFETMRKSPKMAVDIFKSSISVLGIKMGETFIQNMAPILVNITEFVNKLTDLKKPVLDNIINFGLLVASIGPLTFGFGKLIKGVLSVGKVVGGLPLPFKIAVGAITFFVGKILKQMDSFDGMVNTIDSFQNTLKGSWNQIVASYNQSGLKEAIDELIDTFASLFSGNFGGKNGNADKGIINQVRSLSDTIMPFLITITDTVNSTVMTIKGSWNQIVASYNNSGLPPLIEELKQTFKEAFGGGDEGPQANGGIVSTIRVVSDAIMPVLEVLVKTLTVTIDLVGKLPDGFLPGIIAFGLLGKAVLGVTRKVKDTVDKVRDVKNTVMTMPEKFKNGINSVNNLKDKFSNLKTKAGEAKNKINDVFSSLSKKPAQGTFNEVGKELDNVKTKAGEATASINNMGDAVNNANNVGGGSTGGKGSKKGGAIKKGVKVAGKVAVAAGSYGLFNNITSGMDGVQSSTTKSLGKMQEFGAMCTLLPGKGAIAGGALMGISTVLQIVYDKFEGLRKPMDTFFSNLDQMKIDVPVAMRQIPKDFSTAFNTIKSSLKDTVTNWREGWAIIKSNAHKVVDDVGSKVRNWGIVKFFNDKWNSIKTGTRRFFDDLVSRFHNKLKEMADKVTNSKIANAFRSTFNKAMDWIKTPINGIIDAANWVVHKLGGEKNKFDPWEPPKYAKGTGNGGHPGGLAMVNDERGATYREAITLPSGQTFIPQGRNLVMNLPKGTQVAPAKVTRNALNKGILRYKDGTDESWLSKVWNFGKRAISKVGDFVGDVMDYMTDPGKLARKVLSYFVSFGKAVRLPLEAGKGIVRNSVSVLTDRIKEMFDSMQDVGEIDGTWGNLGSNNWFQIHGQWVREWQYRLLEPIIKQYGFQVTDGGRRTWDQWDHSKGQAMDIALPGNPWDTYWEVAQKIAKMPLVKYVNSNLKSTISGKWAPSNLEPAANHIHVSFKKQFLSEAELKGNKGNGGSYAGKGSIPNPPGSGVNRWIPMIKETARRMGVRLTPAGLNAVLARIRQESNGDPNAINLWDSNAAAGHPSQGILQYIQPTLNTWVPRGVKPVLKSGYAQLMALFNDSNWYYDITRPGGWGPTGRRRKYEKGGLVTQHQIAEIGEGNKPEMVIPLTDTSRSVRLIRQAQKLVGEEHFVNKYAGMNNDLLAMMINEVRKSNDILIALLEKDQSIYMDKEKVGKMINETNNTKEQRRRIALGLI